MGDVTAWVGDKLNRKAEADDLLQFLHGRLKERRGRGVGASYVVNVDSGWGQGKTYFLSNIRKDLVGRGAAVTLIDAWATDFSDDPLTAIMSAVDAALKPHLKSKKLKEAWRDVLKSGGSLAISLTKHVSSKLASRYVGEFGDELFDATFGEDSDKSSDDKKSDEDKLGLGGASEEVIDKLADSALSRLIETFRKQERSIVTFKSQLSKVAEAINKGTDDFTPIYILVDELDRCRPTYAIRLLESVKHLFNTDGVVFIIATDTEQLSESIKAVYGANFESDRYLRRFFDRTYRFREPSLEEFVGYLLDRSSIPLDRLGCPRGLSPQKMAEIIFRDFGSSLRDVEQCFDMLQTFSTMWNHKIPIELGLALTLICLYHSNRIEEYKWLSGQPTSLAMASVFKRPSVLLRNIVGGYNEPRREITSSTADLLSAYSDLRTTSLIQLVEKQSPGHPAGQYVREVIANELAVLHGNSYQSDKPPYSVVREYHRYIELAERLAE
ncbi:KAP family NTPase [Porphyrobacter sp. ULC335]|uniref:KAP family P-loop NTPase fold protein n=1 Tax=Porphyrobacter sp. ULC335 TaxID=2854260 RepID=UPI00221FF330|nr:KAP family NTPase [Porphyrobacter sp. ULC335]UYV14451.1 KAP family NTPase [Porphyrobacter sp. ULC335]